MIINVISKDVIIFFVLNPMRWDFFILGRGFDATNTRWGHVLINQSVDGRYQAVEQALNEAEAKAKAETEQNLG